MQIINYLKPLFAMFFILSFYGICNGKIQEYTGLNWDELLKKSQQNLQEGNLEKALFFSKRLQEISHRENSVGWEIAAVGLIEQAYQKLGVYDSALFYSYMGITLSQQVSNDFETAKFKIEGGKNYLHVEKPKQAIELIEKAVAIFQQYDSTEYLNYALGNLAIAYGMVDSLAKCEAILHKLRQAHEKDGFNHNQLATQFNLAIVFIQNNRPLQALGVINQIVFDSISTQYLGRYLLLKGQVYNSLGKDSALYFLEEAHENSYIINDLTLRKIASLELAQLYERENKFDEAVAFYKKYISISDSIEDRKNLQAIENLESIYKISQIEKEVENLMKINKLSQQRTVLLLILLGVSICLVLIFLLWMRSRLNYARKSAHILKKHLDNKKEVIQQSAHRHTQLFETVKLVIAQLKEVIGKNGQQNDKESMKIIVDGFRNLQTIVSDQKHIETQIDIANAEFVIYLKNKYDGLTEKELRLCSLIITGLSSKEIASLLNISYKSVNNVRSVIRKKMSVSAERSIQAALKEEYRIFSKK